MSAATDPPIRTPTSPRPLSTPSHRGALAIVGVGVLLVVGLLVLLSRAGGHSNAPAEPTAVGHIHGIGIDPADGRLYIGAHQGVFTVSVDGEAQPVGKERHDTMGFTVAGAGRFLASGHPELTSDRPPHLGLIESDDAADTWTTVSLGGEADFHALETAGDRTWGADSVGSRLLTSTDRQRWDLVAEGQFIDVAIDPTSPNRTVATDVIGQLRAYTAAGVEEGVPDAPVLAYLDWPSSNELVGLAPDGTVRLSRDRGATWETTGAVPGRPSALEANAQAWYAASDVGLFTSTDSGRTWTPLFEYGDAP